MTDELIYCDKCGHLSITNKCHNCSYKFENTPWLFERTGTRSVQNLNHFYTTRDARYSKTEYAGLLIVIIAPILSILAIVSKIIIIGQSPPSEPDLYVGMIFSGGVILSSIGFSLHTTAEAIVWGDDDFDIGSNIRFIANFGAGICLFLVITALISLILPPFIFYRSYVREATRQYRRGKVDRFTAVSAALEASRLNPESSSRLLELLLKTPVSEITDGQRDFVIEYFEKNPLVVSYIGMSNHESFFQAAKTAYSNNEEDKIRLVETVSEAGRDLRSDRQFEEAKNCFKAAGQLAANYDLNSYQHRIEEKRTATESLEFVDSFVSEEKIAELSVNYKPEKLVEALLEAGRRHRSENRFAEAIACFEGGEELDNKRTDGEFSNMIAAELADTDNQELLYQFEAEVNELYDIVRSGEGALDAGQHQKALQRFKRLNDRLPEELAGDGATQDSYRELVDRAEEGLAVAGRHQLLTLLPESPSPFEQELITITAPESVGNNLQRIYKGTLETSMYRDITTDAVLDQVSTAATQIETYRECRERVAGAVNDTQPYLSKLDDLIRFKLYSGPIVEKRLPTAVFIATAVAESLAYQPQGAGDIDKIQNKSYSWEAGGSSNIQTVGNRSSVRNIETALVTGIAFSEVLAQIQRIDDGSLDSSTESCLRVIKKSLLDRDSLRSRVALEEVNHVVERLAEIELYINALPSLAIGNIVEEMTVAIEDGAPIEQTTFTGEFERIDRLVRQEVESLADDIEVFLSEWKGHPAVDHQSWQHAISEARERTDPHALLEPYSTMQEMQGKMWNREALDQFDPYEFEELISHLYEQQGYDTTVTSGSNDEGIDVLAENNIERVAIQVKQFADGNVVGRPVIQKLESILRQDNTDRIVVVTSSTFSNPARERASGDEDIRLINGDRLIAQLSQFDVPSPGMDTT